MSCSSIRFRGVTWCVVLVLLAAAASASGQEKKEKTRSIRAAGVKSLAFSPDGTLVVTVPSLTGATLVSADGTLRSQLNLPADRAVVVTAVNEKGLADQAGIKVDDVLLTADGKPIRIAADLDAVVRAAKEKPIKISLIRAGDRVSVELKPAEVKLRVTTVPSYRLVWAGGDSYYVGVTVAPVDRTLRSHLELAQDQGVVVTDVVTESPAAKAGVLEHDVLLKIGDSAIGTPADLRKFVTQSAGKPLSIKLLRSSKHQTIVVTPEKRTTAAVKSQLRWTSDGAIRLWDASNGRVIRNSVVLGYPAVAASAKKSASSAGGLEATLDQVLGQIAELKKTVEQLRKKLPKDTDKTSGDQSDDQ